MQNSSRLWQHMPLIIYQHCFFHAQVAESLPLIWIVISAPNSQNPQTLGESQAKKIIRHLDKLIASGDKGIFTGSSTQQSCDRSSNAAYGMNIKQIYEKKKTLDADIIFIADRLCRVCLPSCYGEHITIGTSLVSFYQDGALPNKSSDHDHKEVKIPWLTCRSHKNPGYNLSIPLPTPPSQGKRLLHAWHSYWL